MSSSTIILIGVLSIGGYVAYTSLGSSDSHNVPKPFSGLKDNIVQQRLGSMEAQSQKLGRYQMISRTTGRVIPAPISADRNRW